MTTYADRLLTPDELERVTGGLTQGAAQIRQLRKMGIAFRVSPASEPIVLLSALHPGDEAHLAVVPTMGEFRP